MKILDFFRKIRKKQKEEFEQDFDLTFLKMEGKTWEEHMKEIVEKDKNANPSHELHNYIVDKAKREGKSAAQIEQELDLFK